MFGSYAQVLRRPGAIRFSAAGFLARMQMSMAGLGSVMLLSVERGSFAVAGTVSAIYALSAAPDRSAGVPEDRRLRAAQGVPIQLAVHVPAIAGMIVIALATEAELADLHAGAGRRGRAAEHGSAGPGPLVGPATRNVPAAHRVCLGVAGRRGRLHPRSAAGHHRRIAGRTGRCAGIGHDDADRRDAVAAHPAVDRAEADRPADRKEGPAGHPAARRRGDCRDFRAARRDLRVVRGDDGGLHPGGRRARERPGCCSRCTRSGRSPPG